LWPVQEIPDQFANGDPVFQPLQSLFSVHSYLFFDFICAGVIPYFCLNAV